MRSAHTVYQALMVSPTVTALVNDINFQRRQGAKAYVTIDGRPGEFEVREATIEPDGVLWLTGEDRTDALRAPADRLVAVRYKADPKPFRASEMDL